MNTRWKKKLYALVIISIQFFAFSSAFAETKIVDWPEEGVLTMMGSRESELGGELSLGLKSDKGIYKGKALEVFDNKEFKNEPVFIISTESIMENKKEIVFGRVITENKSNEIFFQIPDYKFIRLDRKDKSVYLYGKSFNKNYIQINHKNKNYYLKISDDFLKYLNSSTNFYYANAIIRKSQQAELNEMLDRVPDFKIFVDKLKACVKAKDQECLFKFQHIDDLTYDKSIIKDHYKNVFLVRQILDDPNLIDEWTKTRDQSFEGDKHIPLGFEKRIDKSKSNVWSSLEEVLSLDIAYNYFYIKSDSFQENFNRIDIYQRHRDHYSSKYFADIELDLKKGKDGWKIILLGLSEYDLRPD